MATRQKISQMTPKGADLEATDLLEVSVVTGTGYGTYSITGQEIINAASGGAIDLQQVTDNGATTTNPIEVTAGVNEHSTISGFSVTTENIPADTHATLNNTGSLALKTGDEESSLQNTNVINASVILEFPNKATGSYTIATTADLTSGTVTSVAALTLGTAGTDLASTVATGTTTPVITLNVPTASATNRGALSTADWTTFNGKQDTLISATNIKTINGNTLLGSGDLVIGGSGITVGTTAVTSGTIGRVFFQGTGDVVQQSANLFWDNTNSRLGLGATPASTVRLDVRSQGALTTDIAFRIRNSANTKNLANITGLGDVYLGDGVTVTNQGTAPLIAIGSTTTVNGVFNSSPIAIGNNTTAIGNSIALGKGSSAGSSGVDNNIAIGFNALATGPSNTIVIGANVSGSTYAGNSIIIGHSMTTTSQSRANIVVGRYMNSVQGFINEAFAFGSGVSDASRASLDVGDSFSIYINQNTRALFVNQKSNLVFRNGQSLTSGTHFEAAATNTFTIHNGTAPITNLVDAFQQYSADVVAGNASPHFRTENGSIIKLYKETTAVTAATFVTNTSGILNDSATFDGYTIGQVVKALRNLGILA